MINAILCKAPGLPSSLVYQSISAPSPEANEVIIQVKACSICFPDTLMIQGKYQFKPDFPFSPGREISGVIIARGSAVDKWKIGDEVMGFIKYGGLAEQIAVDQEVLFRKSFDMDFATAASIVYAYGTAYHGLKQRANLQPGETLTILGASGGVGLAAVQLGKAMGARVIACASTQGKCDLCKDNGADEVINYTSEDLKVRIKELTNGQGSNVILDPVGGTYTEQAIRATAWEGRYLVIGFAAGEIPAIPLNLPLLKGCTISGVFLSRFITEQRDAYLENVQDIMQFYSQNIINPHIEHTYALVDSPRAIEAMMNRTVKGKIVVVL